MTDLGAVLEQLKHERAKTLNLGYRAVIKGSTRHAFTDEAILPLPDNERKQALVGVVPGPKMVQMTSALISAFFDVHLQTKPNSLLTDISLHFPEVTIQPSE